LNFRLTDEICSLRRRDESGRERRIFFKDPTDHVRGQHDRLTHDCPVVQLDGTFKTQHINIILSLDPYNEIRSTGTEYSGLCLHPETLIFELLQGLGDESGLSGNQFEQSIPSFFIRFIQKFRDFQRSIGCQFNPARICKDDFCTAIAICMPFVLQKHWIPDVYRLFSAISFNLNDA
jgi:hypothetical protein